MNRKKQKLELTWIGKDKRPRLEPRILLEDPEKSWHARERINDHDIFDNKLIFGDNLLALKALETEYAGQVKCVFIDPPYNTGSAFEHYDDGLEHSIWLSLMRDRLELLKNLLSEDGSLWITIDDNEAHYLKVLCDEIFGRKNFIANCIWQKRRSRENRSAIGSAHDHVLVYARKPSVEWKQHRNKMPTDRSGYKNPDNDPRGSWKSIPFTAQGYRANQMYEIESPAGKIHLPSKGRCWGATREIFDKHLQEGRVYFGKSGNSQPVIKKYEFEEDEDGLVPMSLWLSEDFGDTTQGKREILDLFDEETPFGTPKPEKLLEKILFIATNENDIVLDSFAGSGTTGAVAHKMGRKWIMVELGEHCNTHIIPRLQKVIDGTDWGGISKAVNWQGGGGFRYYRLAPSMLEKDKWGNWVISKKYNAGMLAEAMCKHMGFTYAPDERYYWMHGYSTETDFIYVTTCSLVHEQLRAISEEVGPNRTLLICCKAFNARPHALDNLTLTKIPHAVLTKCEWGKDDYSLNVANLPQAKHEPKQQSLFDEREETSS